MKESRLARPATEKSTDASVAALSETLADLGREIANIIIAADGQRKPYVRIAAPCRWHGSIPYTAAVK